MQQDITQIKQQIVPLLKEAGVTRSSVFGSFARGEADRKSDVDLLVELPEYYTLLDVVHLKHALEDAINREVDLVEYTAIKSSLKDYILKDQIEIL